MRSVLIGTAAALAISVIAGIVLQATNPSAGTAFSTSNVRLGH